MSLHSADLVTRNAIVPYVVVFPFLRLFAWQYETSIFVIIECSVADSRHLEAIACGVGALLCRIEYTYRWDKIVVESETFTDRHGQHCLSCGLVSGVILENSRHFWD